MKYICIWIMSCLSNCKCKMNNLDIDDMRGIEDVTCIEKRIEI